MELQKVIMFALIFYAQGETKNCSIKAKELCDAMIFYQFQTKYKQKINRLDTRDANKKRGNHVIGSLFFVIRNKYP